MTEVVILQRQDKDLHKLWATSSRVVIAKPIAGMVSVSFSASFVFNSVRTMGI